MNQAMLLTPIKEIVSSSLMYTTVRLTTAEVVQHPHVCPVHITYSIFYTSAVTFFI